MGRTAGVDGCTSQALHACYSKPTLARPCLRTRRTLTSYRQYMDHAYAFRYYCIYMSHIVPGLRLDMLPYARQSLYELHNLDLNHHHWLLHVMPCLSGYPLTCHLGFVEFRLCSSLPLDDAPMAESGLQLGRKLSGSGCPANLMLQSRFVKQRRPVLSLPLPFIITHTHETRPHDTLIKRVKSPNSL